MARPRTQKMAAAVALWQAMPTAKLREFVKAFKKQHGQTMNTAAAFIAKKQAGLTKSRNKLSKVEVVGIPQLKQIHQLAKEMGGIEAVRNQIKKLELIAKAAGGYDKLERCLEMIVELKK